eukprot:TRINITY_DN12926_c0_g1_i1.p1 TRINITY_DN12926_c0_g1~~TRINITY_DN12926_c0_g1_i1.p1  ORF type:complete len:415 (-),score=52.09 TRINITY_DN12926_c0_g1_i1:870-2114(-)
MSFWLARPCCVIVSLCALPVVALGTFTLQKFRVFFIWPPCDSSAMEWDVGICTDKASAVFRIPQFKHVCKTNSHPKDPSKEYDVWETNCVSSGEVLTIGPLHLTIIIAWSCDPSGKLARHSMLGVAVVEIGEDLVVWHQTLTLVNNESSKSIAIATRDISGGCGMFPYPYADYREDFDGFVLLSDAFDPLQGWLSKDEGTLTVSCDVELASSRIHPLQPSPIPTVRTEDITSNNIADFLESGDLSDVTLTVGAEEICAHRFILAAHSPVFHAAFSHDMTEANEGNVVIEGLDLWAVRRMLAFMYNGKLDISESGEEDVCSLLQAAHRYQVTPLVDSCVLVMKSQLTEQVAVDYLLQADLSGISSLKNACVKFAVSSGTRLAGIERTESFAQLVEKQPHLLVELLTAAAHVIGHL